VANVLLEMRIVLTAVKLPKMIEPKPEREVMEMVLAVWSPDKITLAPEAPENWLRLMEVAACKPLTSKVVMALVAGEVAELKVNWPATKELLA